MQFQISLLPPCAYSKYCICAAYLYAIDCIVNCSCIGRSETIIEESHNETNKQRKRDENPLVDIKMDYYETERERERDPDEGKEWLGKMTEKRERSPPSICCEWWNYVKPSTGEMWTWNAKGCFHLHDPPSPQNFFLSVLIISVHKWIS